MKHTNLILINGKVNNDDVISIRVEYGKKRKFVACHYVEGIALDAFINNQVESIRAQKWDKEITFRENSNRDKVWACGYYGNILCYTTKGFQYGYRVQC
jgi:hypothetical protein